jgi:hypothetical protein
VSDITGDAQVPFAFPFSGAGISRSFLQELRRKHSIVGPMFDTGGVAIDASFIFNRITVDQPPRSVKCGSNIPHLLHAAYRSAFLGDLRARVQGLPGAVN